jgi:alkyl hydroperoxide reductase subunit AhpC
LQATFLTRPIVCFAVCPFQDFTFTCPTEIIAISDQAKKLKELGAVVLAGSVDSVFTHLAWTNTPRNKGGLGKLDIQLFSDLDRAWGKAYGCLLADGHHTRATYIINPEGVLLHASQNSPAVGRNTDEVVRLIEGYQFAAEHGEVCPANWKKGAKTIKPDPKASLEYFEAVNNA